MSLENHHRALLLRAKDQFLKATLTISTLRQQNVSKEYILRTLLDESQLDYTIYDEDDTGTQFIVTAVDKEHNLTHLPAYDFDLSGKLDIFHIENILNVILDFENFSKTDTCRELDKLLKTYDFTGDIDIPTYSDITTFAYYKDVPGQGRVVINFSHNVLKYKDISGFIILSLEEKIYAKNSFWSHLYHGKF